MKKLLSCILTAALVMALSAAALADAGDGAGVLVIRGGAVSFEAGALTEPPEGVLVQTLPGDETDAGDITVHIGAPAEGDILHGDPARSLYLYIDADYTGQVTAIPAAAEALSDPEDPDAQEDEDSTVALPGVYVVIDGGAVWSAEDESAVLSLEIIDGSVEADAVYIDCSPAEDGMLDPATGTRVYSLEPGVYENVVLVGSVLSVTEYDGEYYLPLDDILSILGQN